MKKNTKEIILITARDLFAKSGFEGCSVDSIAAKAGVNKASIYYDYTEMFRLNDKVALITGTSEGIGRDLAIGLAKVGTDVIVCSRCGEKLEEVKAEIESLGRRAEMFILDVCNVNEIENLKTFIVDRFRKPKFRLEAGGYQKSLHSLPA